MGKKILIALVSTVLAFLLAEFGARLAIPREKLFATLSNRKNQGVEVNMPPELAGRLSRSVTHNLRENFLMTADHRYLFRVSPGNFGCHTGINAEGFRDAEEISKKQREGTVVVLLGDSCFFGLGVCEVSSTLGPALERKLEASGMKATVYNLAQPGFSTEQAKRLLADRLSSLQPSFVVLGTGWNDLMHSTVSDRDVLSRISSNSSYVLALLKGFFISDTPPAPSTRRVPEEHSEDNLKEIISAASGVNAKVIALPLVRAPKTIEWLPDPAPYNQSLERIFGTQKAPEMNQSQFRDDGFHPNAAGVEAEAEWISQKIIQSSR